MKTSYVVTGSHDYEGTDVLGVFGSQDAAVYFANRVDMDRHGYDDVEVNEWRGPAHLGRAPSRWTRSRAVGTGRWTS